MPNHLCSIYALCLCEGCTRQRHDTTVIVACPFLCVPFCGFFVHATFALPALCADFRWRHSSRNETAGIWQKRRRVNQQEGVHQCIPIDWQILLRYCCCSIRSLPTFYLAVFSSLSTPSVSLPGQKMKMFVRWRARARSLFACPPFLAAELREHLRSDLCALTPLVLVRLSTICQPFVAVRGRLTRCHHFSVDFCHPSSVWFVCCADVGLCGSLRFAVTFLSSILSACCRSNPGIFAKSIELLSCDFFCQRTSTLSCLQVVF